MSSTAKRLMSLDEFLAREVGVEIVLDVILEDTELGANRPRAGEGRAPAL